MHRETPSGYENWVSSDKETKKNIKSVSDEGMGKTHTARGVDGKFTDNESAHGFFSDDEPTEKHTKYVGVEDVNKEKQKVEDELIARIEENRENTSSAKYGSDRERDRYDAMAENLAKNNGKVRNEITARSYLNRMEQRANKYAEKKLEHDEKRIAEAKRDAQTSSNRRPLERRKYAKVEEGNTPVRVHNNYRYKQGKRSQEQANSDTMRGKVRGFAEARQSEDSFNENIRQEYLESERNKAKEVQEKLVKADNEHKGEKETRIEKIQTAIKTAEAALEAKIRNSLKETKQPIRDASYYQVKKNGFKKNHAMGMELSKFSGEFYLSSKVVDLLLNNDPELFAAKTGINGFNSYEINQIRRGVIYGKFNGMRKTLESLSRNGSRGTALKNADVNLYYIKESDKFVFRETRKGASREVIEKLSSGDFESLF